MNLKVKVKLNDIQTIEADYDGADIQEVIFKADPLLAFKGYCDICASQDITIRTRKVKGGSSYTEFICRKCKGKLQLRQHIESKEFYIKDKDWQKEYKR